MCVSKGSCVHVQVLKAVRDGYDVRGLYYWTLLDNHEWNAGYLMKFGVYHWDPPEGDQSRNRRLKPGGRVLARLYADMPSDLKQLRDHCLVRNQSLPGVSGSSLFSAPSGLLGSDRVPAVDPSLWLSHVHA